MEGFGYYGVTSIRKEERMTVRVLSVLITVLLLVAASGCAHLQSDIDKNANKIGELNRENLELQTKVEELEAQIAAGAGGNVAALNREMQALKSRLAELEAKPVEVAEVVETDRGSLRIKVLSGDGDISTAKQAAKRLQGMGYSIERTDLAPTTNFSADKVFYAADLSAEAQTLAMEIGAGTIVRPLTWPSVFDIIVVAIE
jgi:hypothetical protein